MPKPAAEYPGCTFDSRIRDEEDLKMKVADKVVEQFLYNGQSAFISDGSSTFYVGLSLFEKKRDQFTLVTNSLPIAHEFHFWRGMRGWSPNNFKVRMWGGELIPDLMMTACDSDQGFMKELERTGVAVLSIAGMYADFGPSGREAESLHIKRLAFSRSSDTHIVIAADHTKFYGSVGKAAPPSAPFVFVNKSKWKQLYEESENLYIVTTLPPGQSRWDMNSIGQEIASGIRPPTTNEERYAHNTFLLRQSMQDRFIEL